MTSPKAYKIYAKRVREYDKAFKEFIEALCKSGMVIKAFLIGSRARGNNLPYSDYDVVVVIPDNSDKLSTIEELRRVRKKSFPLDLIALYKDELEDPIYNEMLKNAKKLCDKEYVSSPTLTEKS